MLACGVTGGLVWPVLERALLAVEELVALGLIEGLTLRVALEACARLVADLLSFGTPFGIRAASATGAGAPFQLSTLAQPLNPLPSATVSRNSAGSRRASRMVLPDAL